MSAFKKLQSLANGEGSFDSLCGFMDDYGPVLVSLIEADVAVSALIAYGDTSEYLQAAKVRAAALKKLTEDSGNG